MSLEELFFTLYDERAHLIGAQVTEAIAGADTSGELGTFVERVTATLLLDHDWLLSKTDFLLYAARKPAVAERLAAHRQQVRSAIEQRLQGTDLDLPDVLPQESRNLELYSCSTNLDRRSLLIASALRAATGTASCEMSGRRTQYRLPLRRQHQPSTIRPQSPSSPSGPSTSSWPTRRSPRGAKCKKGWA